MVRSLETLKTKYMEIQSDIKFIKSYKVDRLIPTFTNINLSIKSNSYKLKQRIVRIAMKKEISTMKKKVQKRDIRKISSQLKQILPTGIYLFKVNNKNTRTRCEICSKLTIKTPERR